MGKSQPPHQDLTPDLDPETYKQHLSQKLADLQASSTHGTQHSAGVTETPRHPSAHALPLAAAKQIPLDFSKNREVYYQLLYN